jgi:hypothetical protein
MNLDPHQLHTWLIYASIMAFYTFAVFCIPFNGENAPLFSGRLKNNLSAILLIHAKFLLIFLVLILFATNIELFLPNWMTKEVFPGRSRQYSVSEILCWIFFLALLLVERLVMLMKSDTKDSDSENNHS